MSRLDEIRARLEAATPAPWIVGGNGMEIASFGMNDDGSISHISVPPTSDAAIAAKQPSADAEFVANARTDVPWLLAEIHRLRLLVEDGEMRLAEAKQTDGT